MGLPLHRLLFLFFPLPQWTLDLREKHKQLVVYSFLLEVDKWSSILYTVWKLTEDVGELLNFCRVCCGPLLQWVLLYPIAEIQRDCEEFLWYIQAGIWCSYEFMISLAVKAHLVSSRRGDNGEGWIYLSLEIETWVRGSRRFVAHGVISAWCLEIRSSSQTSCAKTVPHGK